MLRASFLYSLVTFKQENRNQSIRAGATTLKIMHQFLPADTIEYPEPFDSNFYYLLRKLLLL